MLQPSTAIRVIISIVVITAIILLFANEIVVKLVPADYGTILKSDPILFEGSDKIHANYSSLLFDHCELHDLDPWDPMVVPYLRPDRVPWKGCVPTYKVLTNLTDGQLFVYDNTTDGACFSRCLLPKHDYALIFGEWAPILNGSRPRCDVIEVNCTLVMEDGTLANTSYYHYVHAQTFRLDEPEDIESVSEKPNIHILVFDSLSHSQCLRSLTKTRQILTEH